MNLKVQKDDAREIKKSWVWLIEEYLKNTEEEQKIVIKLMEKCSNAKIILKNNNLQWTKWLNVTINWMKSKQIIFWISKNIKNHFDETWKIKVVSNENWCNLNYINQH